MGLGGLGDAPSRVNMNMAIPVPLLFASCGQARELDKVHGVLRRCTPTTKTLPDVSITSMYPLVVAAVVTSTSQWGCLCRSPISATPAAIRRRQKR